MSFYTADISCTEIVAEYWLCALCKSDQQEHCEIHYAAKYGNGSDSYISAVFQQRNVKAHRIDVFRQLHKKR